MALLQARCITNMGNGPEVRWDLPKRPRRCLDAASDGQAQLRSDEVVASVMLQQLMCLTVGVAGGHSGPQPVRE